MFKAIKIIILSIFISITFFSSAAFSAFSARSATVSWEQNTETDLKGYNVYMGTTSKTYEKPVFVDKTKTSHVFERLKRGTTYYFTVTAIDSSGNESLFSEEVLKTIPRIFIRRR